MSCFGARIEEMGCACPVRFGFGFDCMCSGSLCFREKNGKLKQKLYIKLFFLNLLSLPLDLGDRNLNLCVPSSVDFV